MYECRFNYKSTLYVYTSEQTVPIIGYNNLQLPDYVLSRELTNAKACFTYTRLGYITRVNITTSSFVQTA